MVTHRSEPVVRADRIVKVPTELNAEATAKARLFWDYFVRTKQAPNFRFCCLTETIVQMSCLRKNGGAIKVCGLFGAACGRGSFEAGGKPPPALCL